MAKDDFNYDMRMPVPHRIYNEKADMLEGMKYNTEEYNFLAVNIKAYDYIKIDHSRGNYQVCNTFYSLSEKFNFYKLLDAARELHRSDSSIHYQAEYGSGIITLRKGVNKVPKEVTTPSPKPVTTIEQRVADLVTSRAEVGMKKYKMSLDDNKTKNLGQWLRDIQEELLDAVVYIEKTRDELGIK